MKYFVKIQLLTYIHIIQASVLTFESVGDPIIGQAHLIRCTVTSLSPNVFIYETAAQNIIGENYELACAATGCIKSGTGRLEGTVDGMAITIKTPKLTIDENNKYWTCSQESSKLYFQLKVYSVPSSITLTGPTQNCDLGQRSCKFTCATDECAFPSPTFTWLYVFNNGSTEVIHRRSVLGLSGSCSHPTKTYENSLTFPRFKSFTGNTQKTVRLQCYITFTGFSSGRRTSGLSKDIIFAVKVSAVQIFDGNNELTGNTFTVTDREEKLLKCIPGSYNPMPTIKWMIGNSLASTESDFSFIPTNSDHNQRIYCVADNFPDDNVDDAVSNKPLLYVKVKIEFAFIVPAADTTISVLENTSEPVVCITSGGRPHSTIKWFKNNDELGESDSTEFEMTDNKLEVTKSTIHVKVSRSEPGWTLYCSASNFAGSAAIMANNSKQFEVFYPPERMSLFFNGNLVDRPVIDVVKGTHGSLKCAGSSNPRVSSFSWNINQIDDDTLTIDDSIQNDQIVNCTARNNMTSTAGITKTGYGSIWTKINLQYGAAIKRIEVNGKTSSPLVINETAPILIACYVDSNPDSTISLHKGSNRLTETAQSKILFYNISSAQCSDTSQYTCKAGNGITNVKQPALMTVQINVKCSPRLAVDTEPPVFAQENTSAVLSLTILAYPIPTKYDWHINTSHKWEKLMNSSSIRMTQTSLQFSLTFTSVKPDDYGEYVLTVYYTNNAPFNFTAVLKADGKPDPHIYQPDDGSSATAGIIGGVVGGLILACLIVIVICLLRRRKNFDDIKTKLFGKTSTALREEIQPQDAGYSYAAVEKPTVGSALNIINNANAETKLGGESTPASGYHYSEVNKSGKDSPMTIMQDKKASESTGGKNKAKKTKATSETTNEGPCYEIPIVLIESDSKAKPQKTGKPAKQKDKKQVSQSHDDLQYVELSFSDTKKKGKKTKPAQSKAEERTVYDAVQFGVVGAAYKGNDDENDSKK